jgi:Outer membrane protein beta-barrel domain
LDTRGKVLIFKSKLALMRILASAFLYCLLLLSFTTNAQVSVGIKAGPDFARFVNAVQGNDGSGNIATLKSGTVTGIYGGVFVDIPLDTGKNFYVRPGVEYVGAGGSMDPTGDYYNGNGFQPSTKYTLHYVDVPVEFLYSPGFDWGRPYIGLGLYTGALVSGTIKSHDNSSQSIMIGSKPDDNFARYDFGYTFTIGLATKLGFLFGIDYQHGFLRVVPASGTGQESRLQTRNSVWGLHLGWVVKL